MRVLIGYDEREHEAAVVAAKTLKEVTNGELVPEFIKAAKLVDQGLLWRVSDHRGGQDWDLISNATKSTRFAISRFLSPLIVQEGFCLFVDCDVVFREDPRRMLRESSRQPGKAVYVVQHDYTVKTQWKMVNQVNTAYPRKNWSSVMLFDCDHLANRRLSLRDVNERPGRDLHRFYWLNDHEIGELDPRWNWLVGEQAAQAYGADTQGIAHFTLGGPWIEGWAAREHDDLWLEAAR